jgi:hypothetical protein
VTHRRMFLQDVHHPPVRVKPSMSRSIMSPLGIILEAECEGVVVGIDIVDPDAIPSSAPGIGKKDEPKSQVVNQDGSFSSGRSSLPMDSHVGDVKSCAVW